jgi:urease accessory protein
MLTAAPPLSPPPPHADSRPRPSRAGAATAGSGHVELAYVNGRTVPVRLGARSPLKLLAPRTRGHAAWLFTSTYGGGLVGGDAIDIDVTCGPGTRTLLGTQASTKVYRTAGLPCRQSLAARVADDAVLVSAPDPLVCFAGSRLDQHQRFDLSPTSSLVLVDSLASGRAARGERWAFDRYRGTIEIAVGGAPVFRDALLLDPADGPLGAPLRMGAFDCVATVVLVGPAVRAVAKQLTTFVDAQPAPTRSPLLFAGSPLPDGVVLRVAGPGTEVVGRWLRERLDVVPTLVGDDPWARKW